MTVHVPQTGGATFTILGVGQDQIATPANDNVYRSVAYSPTLGRFVAVASGGAAVNARAMTSDDGETWTARTLNDDYEWYGVAWSPDLNLFAAVANAVSGAGTAGQRFATSPDGITWTLRNNAGNLIQFVDVVYGEGLFVAIGDAVDSGSLGFKISTSPDGITWTTRHAGTNKNLSAIAYNPGDSVFIAVAFNAGGSNPALMTRSTDGITWAHADLLSARDWYSIAYSAELGRFLAIGQNGRYAYSDDNGLSWTEGNIGNLNTFSSLAWSDELKIFMAAASAGVDAVKVVWSTDGITWNDGTHPNAFVRYDSVYVNDIGAFITVGAQTGNQVWRSCLQYTSP